MPDPRPVLVFDSGAFLAFERSSSDVVRWVRLARGSEVRAITSACVVAQVHRGNPRQARLNKLLKSGLVDEAPFDGREARLVGSSLSGVARPDVVDAHVALLAQRHEGIVLTSDRKDIERLGVPPRRIVDC